ncbi:hypothetical protein CDL12_20488 [Handroanthus impetiginosus]|uniref:Uncharacterized protein n=1 Tax=Handroanthus impetiginosus TaxID=429701 RepID=A0A2G9GNR8_9LAMI|nr:hypothetical protein CDL12_20488 [Handroanthus impetiginosus]
MTMFSADNRQFCGGYGGAYGGGEGFGVMSHLQGYGFSSKIGSDLVIVAPLMAEDESRTETSLNEGAESSSKDAPEEQRDDGWLQLSIGGHSHPVKEDLSTERKNTGSSLIELELMPSSSNNINFHNNNNNQLEMRSLGNMPEFRAPRPVMNFPSGFSPSFFLQHPGSSSSNFPTHQEINWAFRPMIPLSIAAGSSCSLSSSSSSFSSPSSLMASGSYFPRPFQLYAGVDMAAAAPQGSGVDFRVIQPPRRPHSGIWFMLQASQNQEQEPFLPQISKSYLRIKDGRTTIRLVIKYLVSKLRLENESEIEITCKGQKLLPFLTLQHVRDNIWSSPRDFITLLPNSSTTHHIMVLQYARTASN